MENEKKYLKPEADIVVFDSEDIILTSDFDFESGEIQQQSKVTKLSKNKVVLLCAISPLLYLHDIYFCIDGDK